MIELEYNLDINKNLWNKIEIKDEDKTITYSGGFYALRFCKYSPDVIDGIVSLKKFEWKKYYVTYFGLGLSKIGLPYIKKIKSDEMTEKNKLIWEVSVGHWPGDWGDQVSIYYGRSDDFNYRGYLKSSAVNQLGVNLKEDLLNMVFSPLEQKIRKFYKEIHGKN